MARNMLSVFAQPTRTTEPVATVQTSAAPERAAVHESTEPKGAAASRMATKFGKTLVFKGDLVVGEEALLLGTVEGSFECSGPLTVGVGGTVVGDVRGHTITIKGTVRGNIKGTESVVIMPGSVVHGDVIAPRVTIIEGAQFNGSVKMAAAVAAAALPAVEAPKAPPVAAPPTPPAAVAPSPSAAATTNNQEGMALPADAVEKLLAMLSARKE